MPQTAGLNNFKSTLFFAFIKTVHLPEFNSVQSLGHVWLFATPWTAACQTSCPSPTPRTCSNSCPSSWWCHPTSSSSVVPFSSSLQSSPSSGSFPMSYFFTSGGQSIGASTSVFPMDIQGWFPLELTGWISLLSKGLSSLLQHHSSKASILWCSAFMVQLSHLYMTTGENHSFDYMDLCWQSGVSAFSMQSRFVIAIHILSRMQSFREWQGEIRKPS